MACREYTIVRLGLLVQQGRGQIMARSPHDSEVNPEAIREHLLSVAIPYAKSLESREGLVGIMLYGSLVRGAITPFSDIDIAAFYEGEPPCPVEHRMVQDIKVDIISFPLQDLVKLLNPVPRSFDVGYPFCLVMESFLLAGDNGILYDPTGELRRVKTRLCEETSFKSVNRVSLSNDYHHYYQPRIDKARSLLEKEDYAGALDSVKGAGDLLTSLLKSYTVLKDTHEAAQRMGIPEFADKREELASILAPSDEAVEAMWAATKVLWSYTMQAAADPIYGVLRSQGVADIETFEMQGDYDLFWPGYNLYEFGRLMKEVNTSLYWCRCEIDRGRGERSLDYLWACWGAQGVRHRWERLSTALKDTGYDCSSIIEPMLEHKQFYELGEQLDMAIGALKHRDVTADAVQQAMALTEEMEQILIKAIPIMRQEEPT